MSAGRPLKFQSVEELDTKISEYFANTPKEEWTWTGLALYLDTDKWTLSGYKDREEFSASIKNALLRVENGYEIDLKKHGRTGTIFALKNFDWKDKMETEHSGEIKQTQYVITREGQDQSLPTSSEPTDSNQPSSEV